MKLIKQNKKKTAIFFLILFMSNLFPYGILYAGNNGPNSPEAAGFEPVDATDMVNLSTGDLAYNLPLLTVGNFPVNLSYHAGISADLEASWVGLGWYLTPGAINRSVVSTPDDWKDGTSINFNSLDIEENYYSVSVKLDLGKAASVGVGMNWGAGKGIGGSVSASLGPASVSVATTGNITLGLGGGGVNIYQGISPTIGASYSTQGGQFNGSIGVSHNSSFSSVGASYDIRSGNSSTSAANGYGSMDMSSSSFTSGDASVSTQSIGVNIPLHMFAIPITIGFGHQKVKISVKKGFKESKWGALYSNKLWESGFMYRSGSPVIENISNFNHDMDDYALRTSSMDVTSEVLPQEEADFVSDYAQNIEKLNFTTLGTDMYEVSGNGIMGSMQPRAFSSSIIFGKGQRSTNEKGKDIHTYWHSGEYKNRIKRHFGSDNWTNDFYFYFNGQFTHNEINSDNLVSFSSSAKSLADMLGSTSTIDDSYLVNNRYNRAKSSNFVEVFTNNQIALGGASVQGLITPASIPDSDRNNKSKFDPDGIGGYKITSPDGKTYHYSLPVYHYERVHRNLIDQQEDEHFNVGNVNETRQYSKYATHWLLTAITGSDFVDLPDKDGNYGTFNQEDYGYWVELEYGKWSDGFVWRTPYEDHVYNYSTNYEDEIADKDKGGYSFGRKQIYYLDKINTRNQSALFVKDIRYDNVGKDLKFKYNAPGPNGTLGSTTNNSKSLNYTDPDIYVEADVSYRREYSLKLEKIILVDGRKGKELKKTGPKTFRDSLTDSYYHDRISRNGWKGSDYEKIYGVSHPYLIHGENNILDVNDVSESFIKENAIKVIKLNHDYSLAKNSPSSITQGDKNKDKGRLTLKSVEILGKGGESFMPPTKFNYYLKEMKNERGFSFNNTTTPSKRSIKDHVKKQRKLIDTWGFMQGTYIDKEGNTEDKAKAWSLKSIVQPTGAKIKIDYEKDSYWTEAFSRRFWQENLKFNVVEHNKGSFIEDYYEIKVKNLDGVLGNKSIKFTDYFIPKERAYVDLWIARRRHPKKLDNYKASFDVSSSRRVIVDKVTDDQLILRLYRDDLIYQSVGGTTGKFDNTLLTEENGLINNEDIWFGRKDGVGSNEFLDLKRGEIPTAENIKMDHHSMVYRLLANKVPEDQTGGGLRVKELITTDGITNYKVNYDYNDPIKKRTSGITSWAPTDGLKFVPYQSEVPAPGVMYEYVTMTEKADDDTYAKRTRYRHHVLKPIYNIFNPNIHLENDDDNESGSSDQIFWANVEDDYKGYNGSNRNIQAKKIEVNLNTGILGQLRSIEVLNPEGHIISRTENEYINGRNLKDTNKGIDKETFTAMKTIFRSNSKGDRIEDYTNLLSVSSRTHWNNMLKKTTTYTGGLSTSITYSNVDPWLGSFRKSEKELWNGKTLVSERIPAYEFYDEMQSKVINPDYKNMLAQEAVSLNYLEESQGIINAAITTWSDDWIYFDEYDKEESNTPKKVWRKQKKYSWKDKLNNDGTYANLSTANSDFNFDWNYNKPKSDYADNWLLASEVSKYDHYSQPLEVLDVNGNASSNKIANDGHVIAIADTKYSNFAFSGAENVNLSQYITNTSNVTKAKLAADYLEHGFINNGRTREKAHTGEYSLKITSNNGLGGFDKTYYDLEQDNYKISVWVDKANYQSARIQIGGVTHAFNGEIVKAGNWVQLNHYAKLKDKVRIAIRPLNGKIIYIDDFRMHPVNTSMKSYVYNKYDELEAVLDDNNLASKYEYDHGGRLAKIFKEAIDAENSTGGFKRVKEYDYAYNELPASEDEDLKPFSFSLLSMPETSMRNMYAKVSAEGGSGRYEYRWGSGTNSNWSSINLGNWTTSNTFDPRELDCYQYNYSGHKVIYVYVVCQARDIGTGEMSEKQSVTLIKVCE